MRGLALVVALLAVLVASDAGAQFVPVVPPARGAAPGYHRDPFFDAGQFFRRGTGGNEASAIPSNGNVGVYIIFEQWPTAWTATQENIVAGFWNNPPPAWVAAMGAYRVFSDKTWITGFHTGGTCVRTDTNWLVTGPQAAVTDCCNNHGLPQDSTGIYLDLLMGDPDGSIHAALSFAVTLPNTSLANAIYALSRPPGNAFLPSPNGAAFDAMFELSTGETWTSLSLNFQHITATGAASPQLSWWSPDSLPCSGTGTTTAGECCTSTPPWITMTDGSGNYANWSFTALGSTFFVQTAPIWTKQMGGRCALGQEPVVWATRCTKNSDCPAYSAICDRGSGWCAAPSYLDKAKNGLETDVDCGTAVAFPCASGKHCVLGSDCASGVCSAGACL